MENKNNQSTDKANSETSSESTIERGKKAIEADEKISKKNSEDPNTKKEKEKDAQQWRNEG